jgi:hypothetical protein
MAIAKLAADKQLGDYDVQGKDLAVMSMTRITERVRPDTSATSAGMARWLLLVSHLESSQAQEATRRTAAARRSWCLVASCTFRTPAHDQNGLGRHDQRYTAAGRGAA